MRRLMYAIASLTFLSICASIIVYQAKNLPQSGKEEMIFEIGEKFKLIDQNKNVRSSDEFLGKYAMIYFGYAFCPDICPQALSNISELMKKLGKDRDQVVPIFITLDPARDTYSALKIYSENYHPLFVMLTGDEEKIKSLQKSYKIYAASMEDRETTDGYLIDHSSFIYVLSKEGRVIKMFSHQTPSSEMHKFFTILFTKK
jgi:protein SCO1/2